MIHTAGAHMLDIYYIKNIKMYMLGAVCMTWLFELFRAIRRMLSPRRRHEHTGRLLSLPRHAGLIDATRTGYRWPSSVLLFGSRNSSLFAELRAVERRQPRRSH